MQGKILVIDDERGTRESLRIIFRDSYQVILADSAKAGLQLLEKDIGLVFLDYILPDMNGLEALEEIKKHYPLIPVVMLTAYGTEELCLHAFRLGARDYIKKPFNVKALQDKVDAILNHIKFDSSPRQAIPADLPQYERVLEDIPPHILSGILLAKEYVDANYMDNVTLLDASRKAGVNRAYFCKYFKKLTGLSYCNYLNNLRIEKAKEMLRNKNLRISDVAFTVGYNDLSHFVKSFKRATGLSPKVFRDSQL
ncbi:MAG: response regulator [Nitrospirae bacterium]|nr:response regulator [Nitrospirota bacterium]